MKLRDVVHTLIVDLPDRVRKMLDLPEEAEIGVLLVISTPEAKLNVEFNFDPEEIDRLLDAIRTVVATDPGELLEDKHIKH